MQHNPGLYLAALFLWFLPLFAARSELEFLRMQGVTRAQKLLSGLSFGLFIAVDLCLAFHTLFRDAIWLTLTVTTILLAMMITSVLILSGRMRFFREMSRLRREERREMLDEVRGLIDEQKRAKIRARYGE